MRCLRELLGEPRPYKQIRKGKCTECGTVTSDARTKCLVHRPYGKKLIAEQKQEDKINQKILAGRRPRINLEGPTVAEITSVLYTYGVATAARMSRESQASLEVVNYYLERLVSEGVLEACSTSRRGKIRTLYRLR